MCADALPNKALLLTATLRPTPHSLREVCELRTLTDPLVYPNPDVGSRLPSGLGETVVTARQRDLNQLSDSDLPRDEASDVEALAYLLAKSYQYPPSEEDLQRIGVLYDRVLEQGLDIKLDPADHLDVDWPTPDDSAEDTVLDLKRSIKRDQDEQFVTERLPKLPTSSDVSPDCWLAEHE